MSVCYELSEWWSKKRGIVKSVRGLCRYPIWGPGKASCGLLQASTVIIPAPTCSSHEYLHAFLDFFRNSKYFSRKWLLKIAFSAIDLYFFWVKCPIWGPGKASCSLLQAPTWPAKEHGLIFCLRLPKIEGRTFYYREKYISNVKVWNTVIFSVFHS